MKRVVAFHTAVVNYKVFFFFCYFQENDHFGLYWVFVSTLALVSPFYFSLKFSFPFLG